MATPTTIIIPCYNEAGRLNAEAFREFITREPDLRFLFVDDGSTDSTGEMIERLASENEAFKAMRLPRNMGKAEAVRQGICKALADGAEYVAFWDADLATPLDDIRVFRNLLDQRDDIQIVFGSRVNLLGRQVRRNLVRHWVGRIFATFAVGVIRVPIYDTQCGAKMFRNTPLIRSIFEEAFISKWIFDVELVGRLVKAKRLAGSSNSVPRPHDIIYEHPLFLWRDVAGSKLRYRDFFIVGLDLVRIYAKYIKR